MTWVRHHWSILDKRTLNTRVKFNAYVDAAAFARLDSAIHEATSDPGQARIDSAAARKFLATKSAIPNCSSVPAGT